MNERIKEIAKQAGWSSFEALDERNEKFAELIVKECLTFVEPERHRAQWRENLALEAARDQIKEHFGVEGCQ